MKTEYFESAEVSDVGRKRKNNEDACLRIPEWGIFCVADGMGGQAGGDLASEAITTTLQQTFTKANPEENATFVRRITLFRNAANQASKWIKNFADEKVVGQMGSTIVALIIDPRNPARAAALHAGDSRLYRYRNGDLKQLTADHSAVTALAAKLGVTPDKIPAKYQNELLRAVGLTEAVELEKTSVDIASGDLYLLCSDGLDKMQTNEQIAKLLKAGDTQPLATVAQTLINAANEAGGKDNVTVVLVKAGNLSGASKVMVAEEEDKTFAAPANPSPVEAPTPANYPAQIPGMPDTGDVQGDTPHTPAAQNDDAPTEKITADKPAIPAPAPAPKMASEIPALEKAIKPETKSVPKPGNKKSFPMGLVIGGVVILAAGAGIWFATGLKSKSAMPLMPNPPVAPAATIPAKPATPPMIANPAPDQTPAATQAAGREALKNAQAAFDTRDYKNAAALAAAALQKIPDDTTATQLRADAVAQIQIQDAWRNALNQAQAAFNTKDYKNAAAWADEALKKIPNEQAATKLRDRARQQILAAEELARKYQAAVAEAQAALKQNNFSLAETKAREALAVRPDDPAANQILGQMRVAMDLDSARRYFAQADYDGARQICQSYPAVADFKQLAAACRAEQAALAEAQNLLNAGDYSFIARIRGQTCAAKPPFVEILKQAVSEQKLFAGLEALQKSGDWKATLGSLASPAFAAVANKAPFHAIGQWAQTLADQDERQKVIQQLTATFEVLLVRFNIKNPTDGYITSAEAKKEIRLDGGLAGPDRQRYLDIIASLETSFGKLGLFSQNDRARLMKELKDTVVHHE
jgi:protein phosphatase